MYKNKNILDIVFVLFLFALSLVSIEYNKNSYPYFANIITTYIQNIDNPFIIDRHHYFDISAVLLISILFVCILNYFEKTKINTDLKIVFLIKCFFTFFFVSFYENENILDQVHYFDLIYNDKSYAWHYGDLENFNYQNRSFFFIWLLKIIFFIFPKTWFGLKLILCILFIINIYLSLKIYCFFENNNQKIFIYVISFIPSFFIFSSFLTKEIFTLPLILFSCYFFLALKKNKNFLSFFFFCLSLLFLFLLRWWVFVSLFIPLIIFFIKDLLQIKSIKVCVLYLFFIYILSFIILHNIEIDKLKFLIINKMIELHSLLNLSEYEGRYHGSYDFINLIKYYSSESIKFIFNFKFSLKNLMHYPFILESFILIFLIVVSFFEKPKKILFYEFTFIILLYLIIFAFIHVIANANLNYGTTIRFSIQYKLIFVLILLIKNQNFLNYLSFLITNKKHKLNNENIKE